MTSGPNSELEPQTPAPPAERPRVLVVDDLTINRLLLVRWLTRNGFDVLEADSAARAIELVESSRIDLVVLDVVMPGMSGLEALRRIRAMRPADSLPVFMATARSEERDIAEAADLGASGYLIKPLDLPAALATIRTALGHAGETADAGRKLA